MTQIIYADILVVVNIYVTYLLLRLTGLVTNSELKPARIVFSAFTGGFYSLILLIPNITDSIIVITRVFMCFAMLFLAYKVNSKHHFLKLVIAFFIINFVFAGIMIGLWYAFNPTSFLFNNGIVYFNIDTISLLVLTVICYLIFLAFHKISKVKTPTNCLYTLTIYVAEHTYKCKAFLDTGNTLSDPFTSFPVIVVYQNVFRDQISEQNNEICGKTLRYIPSSTISGMNLLPAFKPDKIHIKGISSDFYTSNVYIAISKNKIKNAEFDALLNVSVFENKTNENGEDYETKNRRTFV
ncbi:MAG: sigma-E processing peptidase SpoIIGA [Clostridia bacterium]